MGGQVTVIGSTLNGNSVSGGAGGNNESGLPGEAGTGFGGAILLYADSAGPGIHAVISNTTVSGNTSAGRGGGIVYVEGGGKSALSRVYIDQTTITQNAAGTVGGGLVQDFFGHTTTLNPDNLATTFIGLVLRNSIVAGNTSASAAQYTDFFGTVMSAGGNVVGNKDGAFLWQDFGDITGNTANPVNALLGPLANNGGGTQTHAPLNGSPAIAHSTYPCSETDQRGAPRSVPNGENNNSLCSGGAYEPAGIYTGDIGAIFVNSTAMTVADDGVCSLIEAITAANTGAASGTTAGECLTNAANRKRILLQAGATYTLDSVNNTTNAANGLPAITSNIQLIGNGATIARSTAPGTPAFRLFYIASNGSLSVLNTTLANGSSTDGGAIYNSDGNLSLENSTLVNNTATGNGGGLAVTFSSGTSNSILNSTFANNTAGNNGGAIWILGSSVPEITLALRYSTLSGNTAGTGGGVVGRLRRCAGGQHADRGQHRQPAAPM